MLPTIAPHTPKVNHAAKTVSFGWYLCPFHAANGKPENSRAVNDVGVWNEEELSLLEACVRIQGQSGRVSCLAAVGLGKSCTQVVQLLPPL